MRAKMFLFDAMKTSSSSMEPSIVKILVKNSVMRNDGHDLMNSCCDCCCSVERNQKMRSMMRLLRNGCSRGCSLRLAPLGEEEMRFGGNLPSGSDWPGSEIALTFA